MYATSSFPFAPAGGARERWLQRIQAALMARLHGKYERLVSTRKQTLFAGLQGDVLEVGPGTGANLAYLPLGIRWVGVEPNRYMQPYLQETASKLGLRIHIREGCAEHLPVEDGSVDAVICTLVLCSVDNPAAALREISRVLKPGGQFLFVEHVAACRGTWLRRFQGWARPLSRLIGAGCHLDRETWTSIEKAGFSEVRIEHFVLRWGLSKPHIMGVAVK